MDLALANGKRHVTAPVNESRTKAEILQGLPLSGRGADISMLGGRQKFAVAPPPVRSKIEALHGLPMCGRDADIALAGGRQHFPAAAGRSGSEPPPQAYNETLRDMHLLDAKQACGRSPIKKDCGGQLQAASPRTSWNTHSPRERSPEGAAASPRRAGAASPSSGGVASPRRGGVASPRVGGAASPNRGIKVRVLAPGKVGSPGQHSRRKLSGGVQQPPISEEGGCDDRFGVLSPDLPMDTKGSCSGYMESTQQGFETSSSQDPSCLASPGSLASSASLASLTSELSQCLVLSNSVKSVARTASTASIVSPDNTGGVLNNAVEDVLHRKMETAWLAICQKLKIPYEAPPPQTRRGLAAQRKSGCQTPAAATARKVPTHPFRSTTNHAGSALAASPR